MIDISTRKQPIVRGPSSPPEKKKKNFSEPRCTQFPLLLILAGNLVKKKYENTYIWVNYYNSLTWNKAILGMIPLTSYDYSEVAVSSWSNLPRHIYIYDESTWVFLSGFRNNWGWMIYWILPSQMTHVVRCLIDNGSLTYSKLLNYQRVYPLVI